MSGARILAAGAAGKFGGLVVPELVRRGATVRGLTSKPDHADAVRRNGAAEVAVGDLGDVASLRKAMEGVTSVFYIAPVFAPDEVQLGRNLVEAALVSGVRRIVFSSVIHPILSSLENHAAKAPVEEAILASGLEYTILQPAVFFQNYTAEWPTVARTGVLAEPYASDKGITRVDYRDVAEVAAIALTEDALVGGTFELCAEGSLDRWAVAAIAAEVLGREVKAETPTFEEWTDKAGIPADGPVLPGLRAMYAWYDAHGLSGNSNVLRALLGREPRTLKAFFAELAARNAA